MRKETRGAAAASENKDVWRMFAFPSTELVWRINERSENTVREQVRGQAKWKCVNHKPLTHRCKTLWRFQLLLFKSNSLPATQPLQNHDSTQVWCTDLLKSCPTNSKKAKAKEKERKRADWTRDEQRSREKRHMMKGSMFVYAQNDTMCVSKHMHTSV